MHGRLKVRTSAEEALMKKKEQEKNAAAYRIGMSRILVKKESCEYDADMMDICGRILSSNPDFSTLWNLRRECIIKLMEQNKENQELFDRDLSFTELCLQVNPKSYGAWHHRYWVLENSPAPNWKKEVDLCTKYLTLDERNFHCWDYRRYVVEKANVEPQKEFEFCTEKIQKNFSNYSSWHYRSKLLPILHPHEDKTRPISEDKLKEELELVLTAAFTDPNDSSAWFYQRWLLGYSEPALDIATFSVNRKKGVAVVSFTKAVNLGTDHIKWPHLKGESTWLPSGKGNKYDTTWILKDSFDDLKELLEFPIDYVDEKDCVHNLVVKRCNETSFVGIKMPKFGYEFGETVVDELKSQLDSSNQLLEYEPDSKWTLLTASLLMKAIDRQQYHSKILENLEKLQEVDSLRSGYYKDLVSKWSIGNKIEEWITNGKYEEKLDLSGLNLTAIYYEQYLSVIGAIDLSDNLLVERNLHKLGAFVMCQKLNVEGNRFTKCDNFPLLESLEFLTISRNCGNLTSLAEKCPNVAAIQEI